MKELKSVTNVQPIGVSKDGEIITTRKLTTQEMEKILWEFISGSSQPVKAGILAQRLNTSIRMVRRLIRDLIAQGHLIASSMKAPYGYFVPKDEEEKRHYRNQLLSRIKHILGRLKDFDRATAEKIEQILMINEK